MCMCVYIAGMEGTEGLGLRSVQGYHYWPPCCVSVTPWPWILTFKPTTTPVRAGLGWVDGIPCGDHQSQHTHAHHLVLTLPQTFCCLFCPTERDEVKDGSGGVRMIKGLTEPRSQTGGQVWTRKRLPVDWVECPLPCASSSDLKRCLSRLTVNQSR